MSTIVGEKLRLGILCHPMYGGSGVVATELGMALARKGHEVHFFSHSLPFRVLGPQPNTHFHEVEVSSYPLFRYPPYTLALATKLSEAHRRHPFHILHAHYAIPHAVASYLCCQMLEPRQRPKTIATLHGTDITLLGLDSSFFEITQFSLDHSDGVTAVSRYLADETQRSFQPRRPVRVLANFVDPQVFTPSLRDPEKKRMYACPHEALVGHLSNFRPVKRAADVLRAFQILQRKVPAKLLMIGEGVDVDPSRHLACELGISERVRFLGPITEVASVLAQLDLFFLPSEAESFGLAALEAMACGVPVISTRTGGVPELIEDRVSGILCDVGDYRCMGEVAAQILRDRESREEMARAARRRAVEHFPQDKAVAAYEEYYREVLGAPAP